MDKGIEEHVEICGGRLLSPMPPKWSIAAEEQAAEETMGTKTLKELLAMYCKHVTSAEEATECSALKNHFAFIEHRRNTTAWTDATFGIKQRKAFRKGGAARKDYFYSPLQGSEGVKPVALKTDAEMKSDADKKQADLKAVAA